MTSARRLTCANYLRIRSEIPGARYHFDCGVNAYGRYAVLGGLTIPSSSTDGAPDLIRFGDVIPATTTP